MSPILGRAKSQDLKLILQLSLFILPIVSFSRQSRAFDSETISAAAAGGVAASILGAILSREASIAVSADKASSRFGIT